MSEKYQQLNLQAEISRLRNNRMMLFSFYVFPALRRLVNSPGAAQSAELTQLSQNAAVCRLPAKRRFYIAPRVHSSLFIYRKLKVTN